MINNLKISVSKKKNNNNQEKVKHRFK